MGLILGLKLPMIAFANSEGSFLSTSIFRTAYFLLFFVFVIVGFIQQPTWKKQPLNYKAIFFTTIGTAVLIIVLMTVFVR